ncbi:MAG: chromosome segregation protein SMC [Legionellaceae bacterium]|nr:chromosome segregation protein SMC [Legionellaceae bacterium]
MRLRQLKLAGFKSFVDPIVVPFPSQLLAVVGPNGCGKSNIMDAVRWVMGESHAKNLRGESMVDVIFKGSSNRKPVGQASVELVFDNTMGRLTGPYASYQDISVKRLVTRDGDSSYFLNGTRCRRRDITDIFLGTGAGARGYSIIGQDTISRIIEARPDELRAYLEEAAGVSKYKERRRETLQRIAHTRDNLSRVADIQTELEKQLMRLERQAKAAIRYTELKQDERKCRTEILALKWRDLTDESQQCQEQSKHLIHQQDSHQSQIAALCNKGEALRDELSQLQAANQHTQVQFYQLAADIARLDETIQQHAREKQQLEVDKQQLEMDLQQARDQLQQDHEALQNSDEALQRLQSSVQSLQQRAIEEQQRVDDRQQEELRWNAEWQILVTAFHAAERDIQLEDVRLQHLDERRQQLHVGFEKNQDELASVDRDALFNELQLNQDKRHNLVTEHDEAVLQHQQCVESSASLRQQLTAIEQQLHRAQDKTQAVAMEYAALQAAQQAAFQHLPSELPAWKNQSRVAELMTVETAWVSIAERVLGDGLHALVLESMEPVWSVLDTLHGQTALFTQSNKESLRPSNPYPRLSDKLMGIMPSWSTAADAIFAAENSDQALQWLPTLHAHESIITQDGYWIGSGWVRVFDLSPKDNVGLLSRKQALAELSLDLATGQDEITHVTTQRDQWHTLLVANELKQLTMSEHVSTTRDALRTCDVHIQQKKQAYDYGVLKLDKLMHECDALQDDLELVVTQRVETEMKRTFAAEQLSLYIEKKQDMIAKKSIWDGGLAEAKQALSLTRALLQETQMQCTQETSTTHYLRDQTQRAERHIDTLDQRLIALHKRMSELDEPQTEFHAELAEKVHEHHQLETTLLLGQQQAADVQQRLQETEQLCKYEEQQVKRLQDILQQAQLHEQTLATRAASFVEILDELDVEWTELLSGLPVELTVEYCEQALLTTADKLKRLGAINLLAIEEYQADLQRKEHLDAQYHDLSEALVTLERAIAKMDKETELRLRETFDQVNASFQVLFPRLFGGGHATLELTCGNLLEAGILVMAQPPGKRNNTIYMLSGGEKAMTAVALVFAIFQLNPSPFCMLDEVDAPLDDANVRRFCDLVKEMSQFVQFLFITHNKVTMELADHLIGVTMREPGVSRIVSVDVGANA